MIYRVRELVVLIMIIAGGGLLRLVYLGEIRDDPTFMHPAIDGAYHAYWARGLATGRWAAPSDFSDPGIRSRPYFRPPAYPYLLAAVYLLGGTGPLLPRLAQMAIGLLSALLAYLWARRWYGSAAGLIFSALMATYWIFIYFEGELLGIAPTILLTLGLLASLSYWVDGSGFFRGFFPGLLLGLLALFRPNVLLFLPAAAAWAVVIGKRAGLPSASFRVCDKPRAPEAGLKPGTTKAALKAAAAAGAGKRWRVLAVHLGGFSLGTALVVFPVTIRNRLAGGDWVMISAQGGNSLYVGNNPQADGTNHFLPGFGLIKSPFDYPAEIKKLEEKLGLRKGSLKYSRASRYYAVRALKFALHNPGKFLCLTARKGALFWGPAEVTNNRELYYARRNFPLLRLIPGNYSFCVSFFILGLLMIFGNFSCPGMQKPLRAPFSRDQKMITLLVTGFILTYFLSVLPFVSAARYRVPVIPGLLLLSAVSLARLGRLARERKFGLLAAWGSAGLLLYGLASLHLAAYRPSPAKWHYDQALAYAAGGETPQAISHYLRALQSRPDYTEARNNLGALYLKMGRIREAIEQYRAALKLNSDQAETWSNLGEALFRNNQLPQAIKSCRKALTLDPDCYRAYNNLGTIMQKQGKISGAMEQYNRALAIKPDYEEAYYNLALLLAGEGKINSAITYYRRAIVIRPDYADARNNLGNLLASRGEISAALEEYQSALRADPALATAHNNLANILAEQGEYLEAISHYQKALLLKPNYGEAHLNLAYTLELKGEKAKSIEEYQAALKLMPGNHRAREGLRRLSTAESRAPN